jgi:hypothetical protein
MAFACAPVNSAITLKNIRATSLPASTTVQFSLDERAFGSENTQGSQIFTPTISTANVTGVETTNFNDASIASGACLYMVFPGTDTSKGAPINLKVQASWIYQRQ